LGRRYLVHSCVCDGLVFCIGFLWGDRRAAKELAQRKLPAGEAPDRTPVVQQSLGAPDFGGIAKLAEAIQKVTLAGQLVIGGCLRCNRGCTRRRRFSHGTLTRPAKVCMRAVCGRASCPPTDPSQHNVQWVCLLAVSKSWPRCGHVRDRSRDRCARRSAHNRRHAAGDSHTARPGPSLRNVRRSIRTCLADHHPVGRQRNGGP